MSLTRIMMVGVFLSLQSMSIACAELIEDYYPTAQGSTWTYNARGTSNYPGRESWDVTEERGIDGFETVAYPGGASYTGFKVINTDPMSLSGYSVQRITSSGAEQLRSVNSSGSWHLYGSATSTEPDGPQHQMASPINLGDVEEIFFRDYQYTPAGDLEYVFNVHRTTTFEGYEDITVGAGYFEDCIKLKTDRTSNQSGHVHSSEQYAYLAEGVGVVQLTGVGTWTDMGVSYTKNYVQELVSYSIAPEPASCLLFLMGGAGLVALKRKRRV